MAAARRLPNRGQLACRLPKIPASHALAAGCRWGGTEEARVILFPEGAIKLQGTGRQVLERCDGQRTFAQIIQELQAQFGDADPAKIRTDISQFSRATAAQANCRLLERPRPSLLRTGGPPQNPQTHCDIQPCLPL